MAGEATAAGSAFDPWGAAIGAAVDMAGAALGGPPPSSNAYGGQTRTGDNNVTYNKGPNWTVVGVALLAGGVLWWALRKKR